MVYDGDIMIDFAKIRKELLAAENDEDDTLAGIVIPVPGWKQELDNFATSAPLSVGGGLIVALVFDAVKNRGEEGVPIFMEPWRTMAVFSGAILFGYGAGRLTRGTDAQHEAEHYESIIQAAEEEQKAAEEEKKAEAQKKSEHYASELTMLTDPLNFQLTPSYSSINTIGEYGPAIGQAPLSFRHIA